MESIFTRSQVHEIAAHIEASGGRVGGIDERESLWRGLEFFSRGLLRRRPGILTTEATRTRRHTRKALANARRLLPAIGTLQAAELATKVAADLPRLAPVLGSRLLFHNGCVRALLQKYIAELQMLEGDLPVLEHIGRRRNASRGTRLHEWMDHLAYIREQSLLRVNMGREFQTHVHLCWPD